MLVQNGLHEKKPVQMGNMCVRNALEDTNDFRMIKMYVLMFGPVRFGSEGFI